MLVLKGDALKSKIAELVFNPKVSELIVYDDCILPINMSVWVDSERNSIGDLTVIIEKVNDEVFKKMKYLTFLIVYTNKPEEELEELFDWFEENERLLRCRQILVTCV